MLVNWFFGVFAVIEVVYTGFLTVKRKPKTDNEIIIFLCLTAVFVVLATLALLSTVIK